jgi:hypothetical protein
MSPLPAELGEVSLDAPELSPAARARSGRDHSHASTPMSASFASVEARFACQEVVDQAPALAHERGPFAEGSPALGGQPGLATRSTTLGNPVREHEALGLQLAQRPVGHSDIDTFRRDTASIQAPDERIAVGLALRHEKQEEGLQPTAPAPPRAHPAMLVVVVVVTVFGN